MTKMSLFLWPNPSCSFVLLFFPKMSLLRMSLLMSLLSFVIRHSSFVIDKITMKIKEKQLLSFVICHSSLKKNMEWYIFISHSSFVIRHSSFVIEKKIWNNTFSFVIRHWSFVIDEEQHKNMKKTFCHSSLVICHSSLVVSHLCFFYQWRMTNLFSIFSCWCSSMVND